LQFLRRKFMKGFALLLFALLVTVSMPAAKGRPGTVKATRIARGKYLVDRIGMCGDCHSPRNERGEVIVARYLRGAALEFKPVHPIPGFAAAAPPIAGLPGWTKAEAVKFLMTGQDQNDLQAVPPMPRLRFSRRDAEAVVAYLKSLQLEKK
jgi:hypothetical protein